MRHFSTSLLATVALGMIAGCADTKVEPPEPYVTDRRDEIREQYGSVFGDGGVTLFSTREQDGTDGAAVGGPAVNAYLWRATLETLDFMPLSQTDPIGGVIITDWYTPPETPDERFKLTVYILDQSLRADGVRVRVFRRTRGEDGWTDAEVDPATATRIEDTILTRARELRIATAGGDR